MKSNVRYSDIDQAFFGVRQCLLQKYCVDLNYYKADFKTVWDKNMEFEQKIIMTMMKGRNNEEAK